MKKIDKIKKIIGILIFLLIIIIIVYGLLIILSGSEKIKQNTEVDKIKYNYIKYSRDSDVYGNIFIDLKETLEQDSIDYKKYAECISKLFVIDFYTLKNKNSKEDIGGLQYLKEELKDNFILNASNTIYKYVGIDNNLPEVNNIELVNIEEINYSIKQNQYKAYKVSLKWGYKKDLGYDKEGNFIVIKDGEQLYIVEKE